MAGVRRWIGSHPSSRSQKSQGKLSNLIQATTSNEAERDTHSTEYIVTRLLDPSVSVEEEMEYQGCGQQLCVVISVTALTGPRQLYRSSARHDKRTCVRHERGSRYL
jgi:hypothetical protein